MQNFKDTKEEREKFSAHLAALSSPPQRGLYPLLRGNWLNLWVTQAGD